MAEQVQEIVNGLHHLKYNNHEVLLFHVTDKKTEFDFEFDHRPHQFIDLELISYSVLTINNCNCL